MREPTVSIAMLGCALMIGSPALATEVGGNRSHAHPIGIKGVVAAFAKSPLITRAEVAAPVRHEDTRFTGVKPRVMTYRAHSPAKVSACHKTPEGSASGG
jgi:hypothetical protein